MKVVLTGATGFVGGALARRLAAEGVELHALTLPGSDRSRLAGVPVTFHSGDITTPAGLDGLFDGATWVIHAAGMLGRAGVSAATYNRINAEGVGHVLAAVERAWQQGRTAAGLRVLHVSSAGVLGPVRQAGMKDEGGRMSSEPPLRDSSFRLHPSSFDESSPWLPATPTSAARPWVRRWPPGSPATACRWSSPGRSSSTAPATCTCWACSVPSSAACSSTSATARTPATRPTSMTWSTGCWPVCGGARRGASTTSPGRGRCPSASWPRRLPPRWACRRRVGACPCRWPGWARPGWRRPASCSAATCPSAAPGWPSLARTGARPTPKRSANWALRREWSCGKGWSGRWGGIGGRG
ncbi:MAG: NAD-dependent epimerase/dehydratase family protein [Candidatus Promineofilum sp.]|nr:NAD-dependent epimerase/dehydratase family protein [Promineifilum sp.]